MERFELSPFVHRPQQERSRIALARIIAGASEVLIRENFDSVSMADIHSDPKMTRGYDLILLEFAKDLDKG
jgi:hypothetical protein